MVQRLIICLTLTGILAGCSKSPDASAPSAPTASAAPTPAAVVSPAPVPPAAPTAAPVAAPTVAQTGAPAAPPAATVPAPSIPPTVPETITPPPTIVSQFVTNVQGALTSASTNVATTARGIIGATTNAVVSAVTNVIQVPAALTNFVGNDALGLLGGLGQPAAQTVPSIPSIPAAPVVPAFGVTPPPAVTIPALSIPPTVAEKITPPPTTVSQFAPNVPGAITSTPNNVTATARAIVRGPTNAVVNNLKSVVQVPAGLTNFVGKDASDLLGGLGQPAAQTVPTIPAAPVVPPAGVTPPPTSAATAAVAGLSLDQVTRGLKEALGKGLDHAVSSLGRPGGFLTNVNVRIPLPEKLQTIEKTLRTIGQGQLADQCITTMNQAAEQAVPAAATVFASTLKNMSLADAKAILSGPEDAATQFFRRTTEAELTQKFQPIVRQAMTKCGATAAYSAVLDKAKIASPFFSNPSLDINAYVTSKAMDGLFKIVADEEKTIRKNPIARSSDLLKTVFGALGK